MLAAINEWFTVGKTLAIALFGAGMWMGGLTMKVENHDTQLAAQEETLEELKDGQLILICKLVPEECRTDR